MTVCLHTVQDIHSSIITTFTGRTSRPAGRRVMRALLVAALTVASLSITVPGAPPAAAHRDGCHRWHSCPSDSGSYMCGDLGYDTYCPGTEALPDAPDAAIPLYNDVEPDFEAPDIPAIATSTAKSGGRVALSLTAFWKTVSPSPLRGPPGRSRRSRSPPRPGRTATSSRPPMPPATPATRATPLQ
jgi:hypothetical protein